MTSWLPQEPVGTAVHAARRKLAGISSDATAKFSESSQRAIDARKKGEQMHQDFGDRVKKIEGRVRETAENRAAGQAGRGTGEIRPGDRADSPRFPGAYEDAEANDSFLEPVTAAPHRSAEPRPEPAPVQQRSVAAEDRVPADVLTPPVGGEESVPQAQSPDRWQQVQAGRFGRQGQAEAAGPEERKTPAAMPEPAPVQQRSVAAEDRVPADVLMPPAAGEESVPQAQSADRWQQVQAGRFGRAKQAEPGKPEERKSPDARTGRAQPVSDDDYFTNDGWLS